MALKSSDIAKWQDGKSTYGLKDSNALSTKQLNYPVKDMQMMFANALMQDAYWMNLSTVLQIYSELTPLTKACTYFHELGYLRKGYLTRLYGDTYPEWMPAYPAPGQPVTPTAAYPTSAFDGITGLTHWRLQIKHDIVTYQGADYFIDGKDYLEYKEQLRNKVANATAAAYNTCTKVFLSSVYPGVSFTEDMDVVPFFDPTVKPDQTDHPLAHKWFDQNGEYWKIMKKFIGEVQHKFKNSFIYNTRLHSPFGSDEAEVPTQPTSLDVQENANNFKNRFLAKKSEGGNDKYKLKPETSRFSTLLAMARAISNTLTAATNIKSPQNMAMFDPSKANQQQEKILGRKVRMEDLFLVLNPFDWKELKQGTSRTHMEGNYSLSAFAEEISQGLEVFTDDSILPGDFLVFEKGMFMMMQFLQKYVTVDLSHHLAVQQIFFDMARPCCFDYRVGWHGIGNDVVPPEHYFHRHFKSIKPN